MRNFTLIGVQPEGGTEPPTHINLNHSESHVMYYRPMESMNLIAGRVKLCDKIYVFNEPTGSFSHCA